MGQAACCRAHDWWGTEPGVWALSQGSLRFYALSHEVWKLLVVMMPKQGRDGAKWEAGTGQSL